MHAPHTPMYPETGNFYRDFVRHYGHAETLDWGQSRLRPFWIGAKTFVEEYLGHNDLSDALWQDIRPRLCQKFEFVRMVDMLLWIARDLTSDDRRCMLNYLHGTTTHAEFWDAFGKDHSSLFRLMASLRYWGRIE